MEFLSRKLTRLPKRAISETVLSMITIGGGTILGGMSENPYAGVLTGIIAYGVGSEALDFVYNRNSTYRY